MFYGKVKEIADDLPLSEATYYIMLALVNPLHGYAVMQFVKKSAAVLPGSGRGRFTVWSLENKKLIERVRDAANLNKANLKFLSTGWIS